MKNTVKKFLRSRKYLAGWRDMKRTLNKYPDYISMLITTTMPCSIVGYGIVFMHDFLHWFQDESFLLLCIMGPLYPSLMASVFLYVLPHPRSVQGKNRLLATMGLLLGIPPTFVFGFLTHLYPQFGDTATVISLGYALLGVYLTWPYVSHRKRRRSTANVQTEKAVDEQNEPE